VEVDMSENTDNTCIELHTMIDDADRRVTDLNTNRFDVGENARNGPCASPSLSRLAGDIGGFPPDFKQSTKTGRVNSGAARTFSFGAFHLIPTQRLLLEAGKPLPLGSRAFDILIELVERHGELLSKEELMARVWPKMFVEPSNLTVHVAALRRVLGDGRNGNRYLVNIPGRGYRFVAPVRVADEALPSLPQLQPIVASGANNLPAEITRLVGRAEALRTLAAQLSEQRLITVMGPGGIGQTSVAVAVAEVEAGSCEHDARIVDLAHLSDPSLVPDALASEALSDHPLPSLAESIRHKEMLLVLDNCAQLVEAAASLAGRILCGASSVRISAVQPLHSADMPGANAEASP
jgi:DNA-binding winged helix-turn-helix (wHTH) protein